MTNSGLPPANLQNKRIKFGEDFIKAQKPTQSFDEADRGIQNLEKAAREKVFTERNDESIEQKE